MTSESKIVLTAFLVCVLRVRTVGSDQLLWNLLESAYGYTTPQVSAFRPLFEVLQKSVVFHGRNQFVSAELGSKPL